MTKKIQSTALIIAVIAITLYCSNVYAEQFYKWVDEEGVTHYGETLPSAGIEHQAFEFPENYVTSNPEEDYYSIQNQLQRMLERREQQRRSKQERIEAAKASSPPPLPLVEYQEPRFYQPIYYPHLKHRNKNKIDRACKGKRDCYSQPRFYHHSVRQHQNKTAAKTPHKNYAKKPVKRGLHTGIKIDF